MPKLIKPPSCRVAGRYGYSAVDEYSPDGQCLRTVKAGLTKKEAHALAGAMSGAYYDAMKDAGYTFNEKAGGYVPDLPDPTQQPQKVYAVLFSEGRLPHSVDVFRNKSDAEDAAASAPDYETKIFDTELL